MSRSITILKSRFTLRGGAEKYARSLANAFHEKNCQVTVLTTDCAEGTFPYKVASCSLQSKTSLGKIWEFEHFCEDFLQKNPSDVVLGLDRNRFQTHLRASSGVHRSFLQHRKAFESYWKRLRHWLNPLHSTILHIEKHSFENPSLKVLFTNSHLVKNEVLTQYAVDPKKIIVIHNGVEWASLEESFEKWRGIKTSSFFHFLFIGNNFARKGLKSLLLGLKELNNPQVFLSVVGTDKNQKMFSRLVDSLHLTHQVHFYGEQSDIRPFLQKSDCLVIPSYYDPFANVTLEALAMGLFVVSSKTNGGSEVLTAKTGAVIDNLQSVEAMKKALTIALDHPKTTQNALYVRNSIQHLDFSSQLNQYLEKCLE